MFAQPIEGFLAARLIEFGGTGLGVGFLPELPIFAIYLFHIGLKLLECFQASIFGLKPLNQVECLRIRIIKSKCYRDSAILRPDMNNCVDINNLAWLVELMRQVRCRPPPVHGWRQRRRFRLARLGVDTIETR